MSLDSTFKTTITNFIIFEEFQIFLKLNHDFLEEKRSKTGGINATLTIDTSALLNSSCQDRILGQYKLYAANTHPSQSITEIVQLNKQTLLENIALEQSEKPKLASNESQTDETSYFSTHLPTFAMVYLFLMVILALALIMSRKLKVQRQTKMMKHDLRNANRDSQEFSVNLEMNTVSTYASGRILATASSSTPILTTNYDQYLIETYSASSGVCFEDRSVQVQQIYSNPALANYSIPENCLTWKSKLK